MTLAEIDGQFVKLSRTGEPPEKWSFREVDTLSEADGVMFLDPQQFAKQGDIGTSAVICWFRGKVPDGLRPGPGRWDATGNDINDLTLSPSVDLGPGNWHGHIERGKVT